MKIAINFILTLVLGVLLSLFLPWWAIMIAAFVSGAIVRLKKLATFFVPFFAIATFWFVNAWVLTSSNDFILSTKIGVLLQIGEKPFLVLLITALIGGLVAGVAGIFGNQTHAILANDNR